MVEYLVDELAPLGHAQGRTMFGGQGLYLHGLMFGIVIDETLYLKADDINRPAFEAAGMEPFSYVSKGRRIALSYWQVPAEVIEEPDQLRDWVAQASAASRRTGSARTPPRKRASRSSR